MTGEKVFKKNSFVPFVSLSLSNNQATKTDVGLKIQETNMEMFLFRTRTHPETTDGVLEVDGERFCDTAERTAGRLPCGTYEVKVIHPSAGTPRLVIPRTDRRHSVGELLAGNGTNTLRRGSIVVGEHRARGLCIRSRPTFERLLERVEGARGREMSLYVV